MQQINDLYELLKQTGETDDLPRSIVRFSTSSWKDKRGALHFKKSITPLKTFSKGCQMLQEDADAVGAGEVIAWIQNMCVADGLYEVVMCNVRRDWESGDISEYDYQLIPFDPNAL